MVSHNIGEWPCTTTIEEHLAQYSECRWGLENLGKKWITIWRVLIIVQDFYQHNPIKVYKKKAFLQHKKLII